jgi:hypothetical protein
MNFFSEITQKKEKKTNAKICIKKQKQKQKQN